MKRSMTGRAQPQSPALRAESRLRRDGCALALFFALVAAPAALADVKPGEREKGPDQQGAGQGTPQQPGEQNPLPGIVDDMKQAERKLAETDTGKWTQEEQQRIIQALDIERKILEGLQKLIQEVESRPPSGSSGSSRDEQSQPSQGGQKRTQLKERRQGEQEQPLDPQAKERQERERRERGQREQNDRQSPNDKRAETDPQNADYKIDRARGGNAGQTWGQLPPKQAREMIDASRREPPLEWRKAIEDYRRKLAEPKK